MIRQTILIATAVLLAACASYQPGDNGGLTSREAEDQSQKAVVDMSGFSGYSWGASYNFILQDMEKENYELIAHGVSDLWYRGQFLGGEVQFVYIFDNKLLTSGMWIIDDVDQASFREVNNFLTKTYNSKAKLKVRGDHYMETEMTPADTNARIIHRLDVEANRHVVHYYFADNLVAE